MISSAPWDRPLLADRRARPQSPMTGDEAASANLHPGHRPSAVEEAHDFQAQVALCGGLELEVIHLANSNHQPRLLFDRLSGWQVLAILRHRSPAHGRGAGEQRDLGPIVVRCDVDNCRRYFTPAFRRSGSGCPARDPKHEAPGIAPISGVRCLRGPRSLAGGHPASVPISNHCLNLRVGGTNGPRADAQPER